MIRGLDFFNQQAEPREGWLPLLLWLGIMFCLTAAVLEVGWVPEDVVAVTAIVGGVLLGMLLAKRPLSTLAAWGLIIPYGFLLVLIDLANLRPPWALLSAGWQPLRQYWLQSGALLGDRAAGWFTAVFNNQRSEETIIFALGLGLLAYFLTAFASWQLFRHYRPLNGLLVLGLALALNSYFGGAQIRWTAIFVGLATLLTAVVHLYVLETDWQTHQVDYSTEVKLDALVIASVVAFVLVSLAMVLPGLSLRQLVASFQRQPAVQQTEAFLERAFAGVESAGGQQPGGRDGVGGRGTLPRDFLLGNAPELYETVVMTAVVQSEANLTGVHWRALSYDVYTGSGWALSEERREPVATNAPIGLPPAASTATVSQTVHWVQDSRLVRYSLGLASQFDQEVEAVWRGQTDLVRVNGGEPVYTVWSRVSQATPELLRQTAVADVPPALLARYTALPEDVPQRVRDLAQEVAGSPTNPYDQARALEQFLRQYPYSLEVDSPPRGADPVEYFLFELQQGYCDYYASAMVVLARALGLPARMGIGYLPQPADSSGVQVIYQINGHSWAEVYFAGFGWVEFEPTAAFSSPHAPRPVSSEFEPGFTDGVPALDQGPPPPIPEPVEQQPFPWWPIAVLGLMAGALWWLWRREQLPVGADAVRWSYGRLQDSAGKLGQNLQPSQTPAEFLARLQIQLQQYGRVSRLNRLVTEIQPHLRQLTDLYIRRTYAGDRESGRLAAWQSWQKIKRPLWLLRLYRRAFKQK